MPTREPICIDYSDRISEAREELRGLVQARRRRITTVAPPVMVKNPATLMPASRPARRE